MTTHRALSAAAQPLSCTTYAPTCLLPVALKVKHMGSFVSYFPLLHETAGR